MNLNSLINLIAENILKEEWGKKEGELKSHLKKMKVYNEKDMYDFANIYPSYYITFLEKLYPEVFEQYEEDLYDIVDGNSDYNMSHFIKINNLPIDKRFCNYTINVINRNPSRYHRDSKVCYNYNEIPDKITIQYVKPILNKVCIHFTDDDRDANSILKDGFLYGQKLDNLAWSMGNKNNGDYCFSYLLDDFIKNNVNIPEEYTQKDVMSLNGIGYPKYGNNAVVFIGSGCQVRHLGDTKAMDASRGNIVKEVIVNKNDCQILCLIRGGNIMDSSGKTIAKKDNLYSALDWFNNNMRKY